ncbi:MAG TPA: Glu/Leu/Phe/Val dehydrogenase dimerization domain-containing protein [Baekduia sp.]|uniref:Glu/Leu/Phe/Val family dehydrogenase n=1 Tax=Baekduia sp. TaxID=2600305 RepID=UPI002D774CE0|nr:Glu/Leu/Phe/Val dehydrogenase dimerization domain-containing protein [Baekduia sp.]HET6507963.1 Glu/Leu/Phe/Val dehydrogenase dimerization domain-containing protein [Baekduia sp.]
MADELTTIDEWGPEKIICVSDTRTGMQGVLVIDNTARGMAKGGTRMSPSVTVTEVRRLARVMTWKWAIADVYLGGAKAGIRADPTASNRTAVLRAWARAMRKHIPSEYVLGLDMGLSEQDAAIVQDELEDRGAAVGAPGFLGGVPYDDLGFTGFGVAECAEVAAEHAGFALAGSKVAIQGFGAVGHAAAKRIVELGGIVTAISTADGALHAPDGLDVDRLLELRASVGDALVAEYEGAERIPAGDELLVDADVVIPAARQDVIDERVAERMKAKVIVEGANLPTDEAAKALFARRGVVVVPDFVANAGAVISTGPAMDSRYSTLAPDTASMYDTISVKLRDNTRTVLEDASRDGVTSHEAALALAQSRVRQAMDAKGRLPHAA